MHLTSGTQLGPYQITDPLGKGGMGEVYRATDTNLNRQVAIKVLPTEFGQDTDRLARFEREAKTLATLNHPNIAQIYGFEKSTGVHALVMELVEGPTLADRIMQGPIPIDEALQIAKQIAEALEAAHEQGIIHRDLKPANVKVRTDGTVKVLDFGLAKAMEPAGGSPSVSQSPTLSMAATQAGVILGTAAYMSPEQARGKSADKRADIWSFGVVLFEMLTGQQAFADEDVSMTLSKVLQREPDFDLLPSDVPPRVQQALKVCLQKDPRQRVRDIAAIRLALEGAFESATPQVAEVVQGTAQSKLPWVVALISVLITGLAVWALRAPEPAAVVRFDYELPEGQAFLNTLLPGMIAVSPDGRQVVYSTAAGLYLLSVDEFDARLIPVTAETISSVTFSPDGQWLAYFSSADQQLQKTSINGGAPVVLTDSANVVGMSWESDDTIVYSDGTEIMRVSANGGTPEPILNSGTISGVLPQMLPGGEAVLFNRTGEAFVQSLDAEEPQMLGQRDGARYVPTGHIVYRFEDSLYAQPFDPVRLEVIGGPVPVAEGVLGLGPPQFVLSDSGTLAYILGSSIASQERVLAWVDPNGNVELLDVPPKEYLSPRVSPDGQTLVVQSVETSGNVIWAYDLSGDRAIRQLTLPGDNHRPVFTPDSQYVTFSSDREGDDEPLPYAGGW